MDDLISRQAAIDEANAWLLDCLKVNKQDRSCGLIRRLEDLPSTQFATDTNVGTKLGTNLAEVGTDCISRQAAIDTEGLDVEIRCEMCTNPMHTDRGCDGHCEYDEKLYKKIMQVLDKRIKQLPSAQPEVIRCKDCKWKQGSECVRFADVRPFPDDYCSRAERKEA